MTKYRFWLKIACNILIVPAFIFGLTGCSKVESSKIDCKFSKLNVTSTLVGTVSSSGDMVTGKLTITCNGSGVKNVTFTGSAGWWNLVSIGPSDSSGVIQVAKPAEALGNSDIGTTKTVTLTINALNESGNEASEKRNISIPIR